MANKIIRTPVGKAQWAHLTVADTKWNPDGEYKVNLVLEADKAQDLMKQLDRIQAENYAKAKEENPKKAAKVIDKAPYEEEMNDDGTETGNIVFKFKMKARGQTRNGEIFERRPTLVDGKGKPITNRDFKVGNGSDLAVAFETVPYFIPATNIASVALRMKAVQIVNLLEFGGGETFGFDSYESGFDASSQNTNNSEEKADDFESAAEDHDF
mgnify:CR=1 FL=1